MPKIAPEEFELLDAFEKGILESVATKSELAKLKATARVTAVKDRKGRSMQSDEEQIRALVSTWMAATQAGDAATVLSLIADDAVFLMPGRPPMHKDEFAEAMKAQAGPSAPSFDGHSEIQEITVAGDWAFMWTELAVTVRPKDGSAPMARAGHTLTVLKKQVGKWMLACDANMLAPSNHAGT